MKVHVQVIHAFSFKKVAFTGECFNRSIPSNRKHVFFAMQQTTCAKSFGRADTMAAVILIKFSVSGDKYFIYVFFHCPRFMHPPTGHLPNHSIHPQEFFDFCLNIIASINHSFFYIVSKCGQNFFCFFVKRVV